MSANQGDNQTPSERAFLTALGELYLRAGEPSSRSVAAAIGGMSHTTVNSALRGAKVPSWPLVTKLVEHFGGDIEQFRTLWVEAREPKREIASPHRSEVSVFISYARIDDEATYGRVSRLVDDVANSYRSMTGKTAGVFKDVDSIAPGDDWKDRIRLGLSSSSIFLAFISPAFLRSPNCREELSEFFAFLDANSSTRLIIPLLYANPSRIEANFREDDLWVRLSKLQRIDVAKLRSIDEGSSEWVQKAEGIADRIDQILTDFAAADASDDDNPEPVSSKIGEETDGVYVLEKMAELEDALPGMVGNMARFGVLIEQLGTTVEDFGPRMQQADTFAKKLAVSKALAAALIPIADEMATIVEGIVVDFSGWSYFVSYMLEAARKGDNISDPDFVNTVRGIWEMAKTGSESLLPLGILSEAISQGIGFSRDLDRPFKTIQQACLKAADLRGILNGWLDEYQALRDVYPDIFPITETE